MTVSRQRRAAIFLYTVIRFIGIDTVRRAALGARVAVKLVHAEALRGAGLL